jgi:predicted O-methyltransferase YrrM
MSRTPTPLTEDLHAYLVAYGTREPALLAELRGETANLPHAQMQIGPEQGQLLRFLVGMLGATRCLEVGVFTGYSALSVAMAMPDDGILVALDRNPETSEIARRYFERAGLSHKLDLRIGPALESLAELERAGRAPFDFAFIDADKQNVHAYYESALRQLRPGGVVGIDNVFWGGSVARPDDERTDTVAIRALNAALRNDDRVELCTVPVGDGLTLLRKL